MKPITKQHFLEFSAHIDEIRQAAPLLDKIEMNDSDRQFIYKRVSAFYTAKQLKQITFYKLFEHAIGKTETELDPNKDGGKIEAILRDLKALVELKNRMINAQNF